MDVKQAIERSPMTRFQIRAIAICLILNMIDGYDVLVMPFSAPAVAKEWGVGDVLLGYMLSASLFGMAFGSFVLTPLSDKIGRRPLTLICLAISSVGMVWSCFAWSPEILLASRVLAGIGIGGMISNLSVIVNEYSSARRKALAVGIYAAGYPIGATVGGLFAGALIAAAGWRAAFILGAVLTVLLLVVAIVWLPESYEYLIAKGDPAAKGRLNAILRRLKQPEVEQMPRPVATGEGTGAFAEVFHASKIGQTLLVWVGYAMMTSAFYFANSWTTKIIAAQSGNPSLGVTTNVLFNLGGVIGSAVFGLVAARIPARRALVGAMVLAAAFYALFGAVIGNVGLAMAVGVLAGMAVTAGVAGFYTLGPALYSTTSRAAGFGWMIGVGRLASILAPILVGYLLSAGMSPARVYVLAALPLIVSALACVGIGVLRRRQNLGEPTAATA